MQTQALTLDIIVTDSDLPQLGAVGNFLFEHPLVWTAMLCIMISSALLYHSQNRVKTLRGGGSSL